MKWLVGIDEAGRGPLAGPVAIGLVAVSAEFDILTAFPGINDSKKLSEKKREELFAILQELSRAGEVRSLVMLGSSQKIDSRGIAPTIREAIENGIRRLVPDSACHHVYLDGSLSAPAEYSQETVIGGDGLIPSIMLASVLAKVTRDRYMKKVAETYPAYGFETHKGYGTKGHIEAIRKYGMCAIHRTSFIHLDPASE